MEWLEDNLGLIIGVGLTLGNIIKWVWVHFNKAYKLKKDSDDFHETVGNHTKQIVDMDARHKEDYKQIDNKIDVLTSTLTNFISETKKDNQVILRDKIYDAYKLAIKNDYILEKDSKNYHYALERYLANDGNSYVTDEVEPRMKEFKVFNTVEDAEEYFNKK